MFIRRKDYKEILARLARLEAAVLTSTSVVANDEKKEQKKSPEQVAREWLLFEDERKGASA